MEKNLDKLTIAVESMNYKETVEYITHLVKNEPSAEKTDKPKRKKARGAGKRKDVSAQSDEREQSDTSSAIEDNQTEENKQD